MLQHVQASIGSIHRNDPSLHTEYNSDDETTAKHKITRNSIPKATAMASSRQKDQGSADRFDDDDSGDNDNERGVDDWHNDDHSEAGKKNPRSLLVNCPTRQRGR